MRVRNHTGKPVQITYGGRDYLFPDGVTEVSEELARFAESVHSYRDDKPCLLIEWKPVTPEVSKVEGSAPLIEKPKKEKKRR